MKRGTWIALLFVIAVSLLSLDRSLKLQEDGGIYISLAKALSSGQGYRDLFLTESPPHVQYPPLFPLLLAPGIHLLGFDFAALKVLMIAVATVAVVLVYAVFRDLTDELKAALVVLATGTSPAIVYYTQSVLTELPFLCLSLLAIWWIQRSARRTGWTVSAIIVAALLVSLVFLTRIIGVSLLLAAVLAVVFDGTGKGLARIRTALVLGAVAAVPLSLWLLYSSSASAGGIPYVQHYRLSLGLASDPSAIETAGVLLVKVLAALYAYGLHTGRLIFYWLPSSRAGNMLALLLSTVVFAGFLYRVIRERTVVEYYVFLYACALLVYPGSRQQRYMVPLIPFFWLYFLTALDELRRRLWSRPDRGRVMAMGVRAVVICLLIVNATTSVLMNVVRGGRGYYEPVTPDKFRDALSWVQENTPADSVFMWAKPSLGYVLADRKAVKIPRATPRMLLRTLRERNVDYVVVHPSWKAAQFLERLVEEHPEHLTLVHRAGGVRVYRVDRPAA